MDMLPQNKSRLWFLIAISAIILVGAGLLSYMLRNFPNTGDTLAPVASAVSQTPKSKTVPSLEVTYVLGNLTKPWDLGFLPDETLLFTQRSGSISAIINGAARELASPADVYARGEGGMMGLAVDSQFAENRFIYTCFNSIKEGLDVRVVRWKVNADVTALEDRTDIVTRLPSNSSGRHSGCRPRMDARGQLWIGTGDAAIGTNPQDPKSLGGKILRVDRDGKAIKGNLSEPFDPRIYSYGHRNVQGLALYPSPRAGVVGYTIEHGSYQDDEVNRLRSGNFGWDPVPGYNESVPLTDKQKYPQAIDAIWRSGVPTIAPSGATFLQGKHWQAWDGALAVAVLKDEHVRIMRLQKDGTLQDESVQLKNNHGRLRSAVQGPDGMLYLTTDNGNGRDSILRVTPK